MAKYVVMNFPKVSVDVSGLQMVKPPELSFKVEIDLPKDIEKEAAKDPLLQNEFKDQAKEILDMTKKMIEQKCKVFDKLFVSMIDKGAKKADVEKQLKGLNEAIKNDMKVANKAAEMGVQKTWDELTSKRKEWKKFKIKIFCTIAATIAGLAVSIAAMATSPWSGGAGAAFAIIGFIKAGTTLAVEIQKIAVDIDKAKVICVKNLDFVEKAFEKKGLGNTNEVTAAVLTEFLGISQPSIKTVQSTSDTLKAKYAQIVVKVHDLAKTLEKVLGTQEKLKKEFMAEVAKRLKEHPIKDKATQLKMIEKGLDTALAENYAKVETNIGKIHVMYADTKKWAPEIKTVSERVSKLELKDSKGLKLFREGLKFATLGLSVLDGNGVATKAKDIGMGVGGAVGGYAFDKISSKAIDGSAFDV
jgi:hypothetical protein